MKDFTQTQWLIYAVAHPIGAFEDMRWKKAGSLKISAVILLFFFVGEILKDRLFGLQFRMNDDSIFNIVPYFTKSVVLFVAWAVGNWSVSIFLDGEGTFKNIFIYSSYSLFPYISQIYINTLLSRILVRDEYIFLQMVEFIGTAWSVLMLFSAVKSVHQYTVSRTFSAVLLTLVSMLAMLILLVLSALLLQQIFMFFSTVFTEIFYRVRTS